MKKKLPFKAKAPVLKATIRELIDSRSALQNLITQPLPATTAFNLARLIQQLNPELQAYESTRLKLCEQYGELDKSRNEYQFKKDAQAAFDREIGDLLVTNTEIAGEKIPLANLSLAKLSAVDALNLQWLIAE